MTRSHDRAHRAAMHWFRVMAALVGWVALTGCASLVSGTHKSIHVTSDPPGALVRIDGTTRAVTPAIIYPSIHENHSVTVELAGYPPQKFELKRSHNAWLAANLTNGVVPGILLDVATGAAWSFHVDHLHATFRTRPAPP